MSDKTADLKLIQKNISEVQALIVKLNERLSSAKQSLGEAKIELAACAESMNTKQAVVAKELSSIRETLVSKEDELATVKRQIDNKEDELSAIKQQLENTEKSSRLEKDILAQQLSSKSAQISSYDSEITQITGLSNQLVEQLGELLAADSANSEHVAQVNSGGNVNKKKKSARRSIKRLIKY
jgi:chromosome segregation ATPase